MPIWLIKQGTGAVSAGEESRVEAVEYVEELRSSWNIRGKAGSQLQTLCDSITTELDAYANLLAERRDGLGG